MLQSQITTILGAIFASGQPTLARLALLSSGVAAVLALLATRHRLAGTTLLAPWSWCLIAVGSVVGTECLLLAEGVDGAANQPWAQPTRFIAVVATLVPTIALLGAKRPQQRAWQWIAVSLWVVLALPAITGLLFPRPVFQISPVWSWFLLLLTVVGAANYLPTRYWPPALLAAAAHCLLLVGHLPLLQDLSMPPNRSVITAPHVRATAAMILASAAILAAHRIAARRRRSTARREGVERLWLDFRDSYGVLWALRVVERVNSVLSRQNGGGELHWKGLHVEPQSMDPTSTRDAQRLAEKTIVTMLRRFVSDQWIDSRLSTQSRHS